MSDRPTPPVTRVTVRRTRFRQPVKAEIYTLGRRKAYMEQLENRRNAGAAAAPRSSQ